MTTDKPDVKRYDCTSEDSYHCHGCFIMKEQLRGDYVEWEDYEALQADRDQQYDMKVKAREQRDAVTAKLKALQAECEKLRKDAERLDWIVSEGAIVSLVGVRGEPHRYRVEWPQLGKVGIYWFTSERAAIDAALAAYRKGGDA